jgi:hypothetical protein
MVRPREPHHFEGEGSVRKFRKSLNAMGRSICPMGRASILGMTPWNGAVDGLSWDHVMPMSSSVDA